jgi:hypothetical protein
LSKLKEQFLEVLKNEPRVIIQKNNDKITEVFIKGFEEDEGWCCYDEEDNEIRINGEIGIKTNYKEVWIDSDYSYDGCIILKSIKPFKKYLKFALGLAAIYEQATKQIKNLQRLDKMEDDF